MADLIAVFTTVASADDARELARAIVQRRLAACAQISEIESVYWWKGSMQQEPEFRILFKTIASRYAALEAAIRELHGYELPAIHAVGAPHAYAPYADWVAQQCTEEQ